MSDQMILRTWHGVVPAARAESYYRYLLRTGVAGYRSTEGNLGVFVLRRIEDGHAHFLLLSLWYSYESIRRFAGDDIESAQYYPEDAEYLLELEPHVTHYEVLAVSLDRCVLRELEPQKVCGPSTRLAA